MTALTANEIDTKTVILTFLLFCRIGGCLMIMPGFSSARIPVKVRLFVSFSATLALAPVLTPAARAAAPHLDGAESLGLVVSELFIGAVIGLMGRFFYLALQFSATAIAMFIGVGGMPGTPIEDTDTEAPVSTLITLTATTMLFITDQHWEILRGLAASYAVMPLGDPFSPRYGLIQITDVLADAFIITLQLSSPFLIYSILINFLFGLVNKMTPAIPVFFISLPFVIAGGYFILYFIIDELLDLFMAAFSGWLLKG